MGQRTLPQKQCNPSHTLQHQTLLGKQPRKFSYNFHAIIVDYFSLKKCTYVIKITTCVLYEIIPHCV